MPHPQDNTTIEIDGFTLALIVQELARQAQHPDTADGTTRRLLAAFTAHLPLGHGQTAHITLPAAQAATLQAIAHAAFTRQPTPCQRWCERPARLVDLLEQLRSITGTTPAAPLDPAASPPPSAEDPAPGLRLTYHVPDTAPHPTTVEVFAHATGGDVWKLVFTESPDPEAGHGEPRLDLSVNAHDFPALARLPHVVGALAAIGARTAGEVIAVLKQHGAQPHDPYQPTPA